MVFPGRSLALLCFLTLEFGNTVLLGSAVMSFTLDKHPCPSTISQTQKQTRQPPLFLLFLFFILYDAKILTAHTGLQAQQPHQGPQQHQEANPNSSTTVYQLG